MQSQTTSTISASTEYVHTGFTPRAWQLKLNRELSKYRFSVVVVHRRGGKTVDMIAVLIDAALRNNRGNARYAYVAPYLKQAKQVAWDYVKEFTYMIPGVHYNESELSVSFPNGAKLRLYGADNANAMRGLYFDGVVLDEYADMKPFVWGEVLRPTLSDYEGWAIFIGTPKGINAFHELYHKMALRDNWYTTTLLPDDTHALSVQELEMAQESMSAEQFRQEFLCDWNASTHNTLIPIDVVMKATRRGKHLTEKHLEGLPKIIGVDVARFGGDRSSIVRRWGNVTFKPTIYNDVDNMFLAAKVAEEIIEFKPDAVFVDAGRGEGVIDRLTQLKFNVIPVDFGGKATNPRYANKRTEMADLAREYLMTDGCIPYDRELVHDLAAPTYSYTASNQMIMESKDKMRERGLQSPDVGDGFFCTFHSPVNPSRPAMNRAPVFTNPRYADRHGGNAYVRHAAR